MSGSAMKKCECAGLLFREAASIAERECIDSFDLLLRRTGCGQICTACHPDLRRYLETRKGPAGRADALAPV